MTAIGEAWALHPLVPVGGAGAHGRIDDMHRVGLS
jgi:hypothetical protein